MNDKSAIIVGLVIFIVITTLPFTYSFFQRGIKAAPVPEPALSEKAKAAQKCVRSTAHMKTEHMQLLDVWRDTVIRDGKRMEVHHDGRHFDMSLTKTCLDCHTDKSKFCDRCHNYASVNPYCWDCHIDPKEKKG